MEDDREAWARQLRVIINEVADALRVLGIASHSVGVSDAVHGGAAGAAKDAIPRIRKLVRDANEIAVRLGVPTLQVPGEKPEVDLRPWWSRALEIFSSTARRNSASQSLETLRMEADAALLAAK